MVLGQNVVNNIRQGDRITRITIIRNGAAANAFRADQAAFDNLLRQQRAQSSIRTRAQRDADLALISERFPSAQVGSSGLRWVIERTGTGTKPSEGSTAVVNLRGSLLSGEAFANTDLSGGAQEIPVGQRRIIPGLDEAIMDMSPGEKRIAILPPELAYGEQGLEDLIPPNSFLIFEIELIRFQ
ncbi:MAG: FKBP-type peptidyl-prolyl cis-trans isomerase [Treponema sp.]|nr:FKBP-type peptidyl-prolyl cis-trans isomerase [Treponema sp.]